MQTHSRHIEGIFILQESPKVSLAYIYEWATHIRTVVYFVRSESSDGTERELLATPSVNPGTELDDGNNLADSKGLASACERRLWKLRTWSKFRVSGNGGDVVEVSNPGT